jgi:hypothetical protein
MTAKTIEDVFAVLTEGWRRVIVMEDAVITSAHRLFCLRIK